MQTFELPETVREQVRRRRARLHAYERIDPATSALVVVDMQNYFMQPGMPACCDAARDIVPNVNRLAGAVRGAGGTVVWIVTEALPAAAQDWLNLYELGDDHVRQARIEQLAAGSEGYALWPTMARMEADLTVTKTRYSAFIEGSSDLEPQLRARAVDTVLVAGVATNVCCESTARDAMMRGFRTVMVSDANAANSQEEHAASLTTFTLYFGDVQTTDQVIDNLSRSSGVGAAAQ
ncbi:MAG TPA: isochorismatase family cysteine hydrolase [Alphaproteobacteria bacterium]|nr:isochorismatase family cysteine hydrolase [Alphaproteobacteria bacterium]